ncbi:lipase maturation factor 2 [Trichuris trichiura]|uniref:Lipase maturation factor n=1 Tax=Trichuris trichiura TaxID=36087 RepID=A0A077ZHQ6_TRITR|nr:lipase maturation factor 2 [Trichuris trichiura]
MGNLPTILHLSEMVSLSPSEAMEAGLLVGMLVAGLSFTFVLLRNTFSYLVLWYLYLSFVQVGGDFLYFQWDTLLLEAGFLAVLLAPVRILRRPSTKWLPQDNVTLFLFRWLGFRLMFASGVVKLLIQDQTWWTLTALHYHFNSQCIPTPLAWYAHQLPGFVKQFSVAATFVILIFLSLFMLSPSKHLRYVAFGGQTLLMVLIALTGNYNFFNFLCVVICSSALVDSSFSRTDIELAKFHPNVTRYLPWVMLLGITMFFSEVIAAMLRLRSDFKKEKIFKRIWYGFQCTLICIMATAVFSVSLVPLTFIDRFTWDHIPQQLKDAHEATEKYHIAHSYGLFASMTGVGGRPEIVLEGANKINGTWKEYNFLYKPGAPYRRPPIVEPHQPRLDWQMWFASLTNSFREMPWFLSMTHKLLKQSKPVMKLIDKSPFEKPPKYIRATLYTYNFTNWDDLRNDWWTRKAKKEFMPPTSVDNGDLLQYLKENNLIVEKTVKRPQNSMASRFLQAARQFSDHFSGVQFVYGITCTVLAPVLVPKVISKKAHV